MRIGKRAPRPRTLPLFSGQPLSAADYRLMAEKDMSEREIQRALVTELRTPALTHGPVLVFHVPNGVWVPKPCDVPQAIWSRIWSTAWAILFADGALAGVCDLVVAHAGRVLFLEMKSAKGVLSDDQLDFERAVEAAGHEYACVNSLSTARALLQERGILK